MPAPEAAKAPASKPARTPNKPAAVAGTGRGESDQEFERRTTAENRIPASADASATSTEVPGTEAAPKGPLEAIALYKKLLAEYPSYKVVTRSSTRWRERMTNSVARMKPWKPWNVQFARIRIPCTSTRCSSAGVSTSLRAENFGTPRMLIQRSPTWAPIPHTTSSLSTSSAGQRLQTGTI